MPPEHPDKCTATQPTGLAPSRIGDLERRAQEQAETIKALADALEEAKALIDQYAHSEPVSTGGMMATRDHVDAALRKAGRLP